jgi:hypothetical protein
MSDNKTTESILLVAIERGFLQGRMVEPGQTFQFNPVGADGKPRKLPKWAAKKGDPVLNKPKPVAGDLKPKAAQDASKKKRDGLIDDLAG